MGDDLEDPKFIKFIMSDQNIHVKFAAMQDLDTNRANEASIRLLSLFEADSVNKVTLAFGPFVLPRPEMRSGCSHFCLRNAAHRLWY